MALMIAEARRMLRNAKEKEDWAAMLTDKARSKADKVDAARATEHAREEVLKAEIALQDALMNAAE